jgi:sugar-specific transcriptional regulator TrmB
MFRDEDIETLKRLGLTLLQAKTYLALSIIGSATMSTISKFSNLARQDVYRVMPILQENGLVEKVLKRPSTYTALPIKEGLSLLLQQRKDDYAALQKKALALVDRIQENKENKPPNEEDETQFAIIYDQALLFQKFEKHNTKAQKSIDVSGAWSNMKWLISLCNCVDDLFTLAMKKGVRIRILAENRGEDFDVDKNIESMSKKSLFEVRFMPAPMPMKLVLYDAKEAYTSISLSHQTDLPMMWSNNPSFVRIMTNQFDEFWTRAKKFKAKKRQRTSKAAASEP